MGEKEFLPSIKGAILADVELHHASNRQAAKTYGCDEKTVRDVRSRAHEAADKENINIFEAAMHNKPRPGGPQIIDVRDRRRLVRHAIKNKANRLKSWGQIATEYGIQASITVINNAFKIAGYGRHPPRYKPPLNDVQKKRRLQFCIEMLEKDPDWWKKVVWTDETPAKVGQKRGQRWITRKRNEAFHPDCVIPKFKKYTDLQFWGCFTTEIKGPCHTFTTETREEKELAVKDLEALNAV